MIISPVSDRIPTDAPEVRAHGNAPFENILRQADSSPPEAPLNAQRIEAREAAQALVASAFLVPMLASVRDASFAAGPFAPNTAERRFGPLIDQQIADHVMRGTNFALVDAIVERIARVDTNA